MKDAATDSNADRINDTQQYQAQIENLQAERDTLRTRLASEEQRLQRTEDELRRVLSESHALYLTSLDISSQLDINDILRSVLRRAVNMLKVDTGLIYLVDKDTGELVITAEHNYGVPQVGKRLRPGEQVAGQVLLTGMPVILNEPPPHDVRAEKTKTTKTFAIAAVPLRWNTSITGVMALSYTRPGVEFSLDDVDSIQRITVQASIAIHNEQIHYQERERNRQLQTIYTASAKITESLDPRQLMRGIGEAMTSALNVTRCIVLEYNTTDGMLVQGDYNVTDETAVSATGIPDALGNLRTILDVVQQNQWMIVQRSDPMLQPEVSQYMQRWGLRSALIVPMMVGQRLVGMVLLGENRHTRRFTMSDVGIAHTLATQAAVALRHAQLHQQLQSQRVNEQAVLLAFTKRMLEIHDMLQVAEQVVSATATAFEVRYCSLMIPEGDALRTYASLGWDRYLTIRRTAPQPSVITAVQYAITMREIVTIEDATTESRFVVPPMITNENLRSVLIVPIAFRDDLLGVLIISRHEPNGFSKDDARLASLLASQAGVALERARLFESVQKYAQQLEAKVEDRTLEVKTEQQRIHALLETTDEELLVLNLEGHIQQVNRAFEDKHGLRAAELIGKNATEIVGSDLLALSRLNDANGVWRGEVEIKRKDNTSYMAATTLSWVKNASNANVGIIASLRDLSYRTEVEQMKTQFVSNVSHELRTPLANIKLYLHLLDTGVDNRRGQYMRTLQREADRLQALIEALLAVSKLERNDVPMNLRAVDVNGLVKTLIEDRLHLIRDRKLTINSVLHQDTIYIYGDEIMIGQALTNLLTNAMNYTEAGGGITVETRLDTKSDPAMVAICVIDTGIGMSKEEQDKLFERFYRGNAARQTGAAGTGLGMSIVKEIVDRHKGSISIESEPGHGSTFILRFPIYSTVPADRL